MQYRITKLTLQALTAIHTDATTDKWGWSTHQVGKRILRTNGTAYHWTRQSAYKKAKEV
jgi:hypothetical protein